MPVIGKLNNVPFFDAKLGLPAYVNCNWRLVDSSNVARVGWPTSGEPMMLAMYTHGGCYAYLGVSRQRTVAAAYAGSTGEYIARRIKPNFKAVRLM